jgi:hypothetical protein
MAGPSIQPLVDVYGKYARASNLADYLELLAIHGEELLISQLADLIKDQGWTAKMKELFAVPPPPPPTPEEEAEDDLDEGEDAAAPPGVGDEEGSPQARRVFDVLAERSDILGDLYPFDVSNKVALKTGTATEDSPYIALLTLTLAHAHSVEVQPDPAHPKVDPKQVLEAVVVGALSQLGLACVNVGEISRATNNFYATVMQAGTAIGLQPTPDAAISLKNANEEGVDALAHLARSDTRAGNWILIGQVTCAKSEEWKAKIAQPSGPDWESYLNVMVEPIGFLAVPHHVEANQLAKLVKGANRMVLDRLRLARFHAGVSQPEKQIIQAVIGVGVELPA